jgi:ParB family chromosome partitioning protein
MTQIANIESQMTNLEADVEFILSPTSIKKAMKSVEAPSRDLWQVEPSKLRVIPNLNPRVETERYKAHLDGLVESMLQEGFYQDKPLAGYVSEVDGEQVILIYEGGSRLKAALMAIEQGAEFTRVPVSVSQEGVAMEDILVAMVRGNGGLALTPYENALICKRLAKFGMDVKEISKRLGFSDPYTMGLLSLMSAPTELRQMVATDVVAASLAISMLSEHGPKALEKLLEAKSSANAQGKTRVTKKFVAGALFEKTVKKSAKPMFAMLADIKADPAFTSLSADIQKNLLDLLSVLNSSKENTEQEAAETITE